MLSTSCVYDYSPSSSPQRGHYALSKFIIFNSPLHYESFCTTGKLRHSLTAEAVALSVIRYPLNRLRHTDQLEHRRKTFGDVLEEDVVREGEEVLETVAGHLLASLHHLALLVQHALTRVHDLARSLAEVRAGRTFKRQEVLPPGDPPQASEPSMLAGHNMAAAYTCREADVIGYILFEIILQGT